MRERSRGETDITSVFGTDVPGSNPGGSTSTANATATACRCTLCQDSNAGAMSRKLARPRGGAQPEPSDGEVRGAGDP